MSRGVRDGKEGAKERVEPDDVTGQRSEPAPRLSGYSRMGTPLDTPSEAFGAG
jgi:hypothetical protein